MSEPTAVEPTGKLLENRESNPSQGEEQPLEAEIVESNPAASSEPAPAENGQVFSLVHQSQSQGKEAPDCLVQWAILDDSRETSLGKEGTWLKFPIWLDNLLNPWGISSLLLLLVANILLTYAQFGNSRNLPVASSPVESSSDFFSPAEELSPSPPSHLAANPPAPIKLTSLSTLPPPPLPPVKANLPPAVQVTPVTATPSNSLSNALLPPSLQPQLGQPYAQPYAPPPVQPYSVVQPPATPSRFLPPPPPFQSLSVPPAIQPPLVPAELPPPPPPTQAELSEEQAVPLPAGVQIPPDINTKDLPPLGNVQKYRLKVQSAQNQTNPQPTMEQLQRLQQPQ